MISIRKLAPADAEAYLQLRLLALQESPNSFSTSYEDTIKHPDLRSKFEGRLTHHPDTINLGAFDGDNLLSVATIRRESNSKLRHKGSIVAVYTTPARRGEGISRKVITELINQAKQMDGLEQLQLSVTTSNTPAYQLYLSLGFEMYGTKKTPSK
ncbi:GNAT family N-acetyltransferase [Brevibacillus daliensis]|uniref:GNAT family N-acetyltransferase n=1 Tax=Brevibacillus daliensis TaxID=2892995 RepID=UPI001E2C82D6|nr:GNAT family N-acetyltransferase [Brevibacillus daliensis]